MRSAITPQVVRDDGLDLFGEPDAARLTVPSVFLCAPRGMVDDPHPMQPLADVQAWAAADPGRRRAVEVPDTNHYTIAWGAHGAAAVADAIAAAAPPADSTRSQAARATAAMSACSMARPIAPRSSARSPSVAATTATSARTAGMLVCSRPSRTASTSRSPATMRSPPTMTSSGLTTLQIPPGDPAGRDARLAEHAAAQLIAGPGAAHGLVQAAGPAQSETQPGQQPLGAGHRLQAAAVAAPAQRAVGVDRHVPDLAGHPAVAA